MTLIYRIDLDKYQVKNYFAANWYSGRIYIDVQRTTFPVFFAGFIVWFDGLDLDMKPNAVKLMDNVTEISVRMINLLETHKKNKRLKQEYRFRSKAELTQFITGALELSEHHGQAAYIIKAVLLAHRDYKREHLYNPNTGLTRYHFYYTILYHCWFARGKIKPRRCILLPRK